MNNKKHRINIIDIVVVVLLFLITLVFGYVCFKDTSLIDFSQKETFNLTLVASDIHVKHSGLLKPGKNVSFSQNGEDFGVIKSVKLEKSSYEYINKASNTSTTYKLPDKDNATILIECQGDIINGEYYVSDNIVIVGDEISLFTPDISFVAKVINIQEGN